jgi:hypothetical protein
LTRETEGLSTIPRHLHLAEVLARARAARLGEERQPLAEAPREVALRHHQRRVVVYHVPAAVLQQRQRDAAQRRVGLQRAVSTLKALSSHAHSLSWPAGGHSRPECRFGTILVKNHTARRPILTGAPSRFRVLSLRGGHRCGAVTSLGAF